MEACNADCDGVMKNAAGTALVDLSHGYPGCEKLDLLAEVCVAAITKKRKRLSKDESAVLKERFKMKSKIDRAEMEDLADQLKMNPRQVQVWFQNMRIRNKEELHKAGKRSSEVHREEMESLSEETKLLKEKNEELLKELAEIKAAQKELRQFKPLKSVIGFLTEIKFALFFHPLSNIFHA